MFYLNLHTDALRAPRFLGSDNAALGAWLRISGYCVGQENGGVIRGARAWNDRQWAALGVTLAEVQAASQLLTWDGDDLHVSDYPTAKQAEVQAKREAGRIGGIKSGEARSTASSTPSSTASTEGERKLKLKRKRKGNANKGGAGAPVVGAEVIPITGKTTIPSLDECSEVRSMFNRLCSPPMPEAEYMTKKRQSAIRARWNDAVNVPGGPRAWFETLFAKAAASDFLCRRNAKPGDTFRCNFDWLLEPRNFPKVLEGNYDNNGGREPSALAKAW